VNHPAKLLALVSQENIVACVIAGSPAMGDPFDLVAVIRKHGKNPEMKIIVVSEQTTKDVVLKYLRAGATDFVAKPFENKGLYDRILYQFTPKKEILPEGFENIELDTKNTPYFNQLLQATEALSRVEPGQEQGALYSILKHIADQISSNRTNLVCVEEESQTGVVMASSDDASFHDYPIDLRKYPEILHVMRTGAFVLVEDVARNTLTRGITDKVKTIQIGSLMVFPVRFHGRIRGVLTIRRPTVTELPPMQVLRVLQAIANVMAAHSNIRTILRRIYSEQALKGK
jgi:CheY-like chemotaxis protein